MLGVDKMIFPIKVLRQLKELPRLILKPNKASRLPNKALDNLQRDNQVAELKIIPSRTEGKEDTPPATHPPHPAPQAPQTAIKSTIKSQNKVMKATIQNKITSSPD